MSHLETGPLGGYNSLLDKNLSGYFANTRMRRHLLKSGLIDKNGHITSENAYRLKMAKKEHRKRVRELLANAIVEKALDMERMRQHEIRKRLDDLYKIELVKKVRSERGKHHAKDDLVAILSPQSKKKSKRLTKSAVTTSDREKMKLPDIHFDERNRKLFFESSSVISDDGLTAVRAYQHPVPPKYTKTPHPPTKPHPPAAKKAKKKRKTHRGLMLAKSDHLIAHRVQLQSMAEVTMKFLGSPLNLTNDLFPATKLSEVQVIQQHCGGSTICVFRELLPPNTMFTFVSRRHRGSPFGLTINLNGVCNIRVSSCCEYKHNPGYKIGGKNSQFALVSVQGAAPCYRCQIRLNLIVNDMERHRVRDASSDEEDAAQSFDVIVSRAGKRRESEEEQPERPPSANVGTQTSDEMESHTIEKNNNDEQNEYQYETFEDDDQERTVNEEPESSSESSSSENEDNEEETTKIAKDVKNETESSSSDSESEDETEKENKEENAINLTTDDNDNKSSDSEEETEKEAEVTETTEDETHVNIEEETKESSPKSASESEDESKDEQKASVSDKSGSDSDHSEKEIDDSDNDSVSSKSSRSSKSSNSDAESGKEDEGREKSDTEKEMSDHSDAEASDKEHEELDIGEEKDEVDGTDRKLETDASEQEIDYKEDEGEGAKVVVVTKNADEEGEDQKEEEHMNENNKSLRDHESVTSCISRESTMLTGNEDGRCDSENKTIQFNEEVDVVHYEKIDVQSPEMTPRSDTDTETDDEFDTVKHVGEHVVLTDLGEDTDVDLNAELVSQDKNEDKEGLDEKEKETDEEEQGNSSDHDVSTDDSDGTIFDKGNDPDKVATKNIGYSEEDPRISGDVSSPRPGSVRGFVENWKDVELHDTILSPEQTDEFADLLGDQKEEIESISLRNTIINGGIEKLADCIKESPNIKLLNLNTANLGPEDAMHIGDIIQQGQHSLQVLMLHGNPLYDEGVTTIAKALSKDKRIKILDLGYCEIGDSGMEALCDYLSGSTSLEELTISSNEFTMEGWQYLANALKVNKSLKTLSIDGNKLGDDGFKILSHGISHNKSLVSLDIENNDIDDDGGNYLLKAVEQCSTLTDITLKPNPFCSDIENEIRDLIADRQRKHIIQETMEEEDSQGIEAKPEIRDQFVENDNQDNSQHMKEKELDESTEMIGKDQVESHDNEGKEHFEDLDKEGMDLVEGHDEDGKDQVEVHHEKEKNQVVDHDEEEKSQVEGHDEEEKNQVEVQDNEEKGLVEGHDKELNVLVDAYVNEKKDQVKDHDMEGKNQQQLLGEMMEGVDDDTKEGNLNENTENAKNNNYDSIISEVAIKNGIKDEELEDFTPKEDLTSSSSSSSSEENSDFEKEKRRHKKKKKKEKELVKFEKNIPEIRETFENDSDDSPHNYRYKTENEEDLKDNGDDKTNVVVVVENHTEEHKEKIQEIETIKENIKDNLQRSDGELRTEDQDNGKEQGIETLHENETGPAEMEMPMSNRSQEDDAINGSANVEKASKDELGIN